MEDESIDKQLDDVLKHYGVKGMKWGVRKKSDSSNVKLENTGSGGGGGSEEEEDDEEKIETTYERIKKQQEIKKELDEMKGKVGDGPLDTLRYILTGKTKASESPKPVTPEQKKLDKEIKEMKGKVGNNPLDTLKYVLTGKTKNGSVKSKVKDVAKQRSAGERLLIKIFGEAKNQKTTYTTYYNPTTGESKTITRTIKR